MISALRLGGVDSTMMIEGSVDTAVLTAFVETMLAPRLRSGDIVIWDNVSMHLNVGIRAIIEAKKARVMYLPAYSPDLNPIEECISKIKTYLRGAKARTKLRLQRALKRALELITPADIVG